MLQIFLHDTVHFLSLSPLFPPRLNNKLSCAHTMRLERANESKLSLSLSLSLSHRVEAQMRINVQRRQRHLIPHQDTHPHLIPHTQEWRGRSSFVLCIHTTSRDLLASDTTATHIVPPRIVCVCAGDYPRSTEVKTRMSVRKQRKHFLRNNIALQAKTRAICANKCAA